MDAAQLSRALDQLVPATPSPTESDGQANDKRKGNNYKSKSRLKTNKAKSTKLKLEVAMT